MPVTVKIPAPLRPLTQNQGEVVVENAGTVGAAIDELSRKYPAIKDKLLDDKGGLRRYVNLFKNDEDVRHAQGLGTALKEGDRLTIVPAIAGGEMELSPAKQERYARHLILDGLGGEGQERLLAGAARVRGTGEAAHWAARY